MNPIINWKRSSFKMIVYLIICIVIDALKNGISQIGANYMATYQMSNTVDSSFWIQITPHINLIYAIIAFLFGVFVFRNEIKYIWNYGKDEKKDEQN